MSMHADTPKVYVVVRRWDTRDEVQRFGPMPQWKAGRVTAGLLVNLDRKTYGVFEEDSP